MTSSRTSASASTPATAWPWSGATARARPRCCASWRAGSRRTRARSACRGARPWRCTTSARRSARDLTLERVRRPRAWSRAQRAEAELAALEARMAGGRRRPRGAGRLRGRPGARWSAPAATRGAPGWSGCCAASGIDEDQLPRPLDELLGRRADPRVAGARRSCRAPTSCCWTSPRTTSTSRRWSGWSAPSRSSARRSSSSRTTAGSWSRWPPGCSSSSAAAPSCGRCATRRSAASARWRSTARGPRPSARPPRSPAWSGS